MIDLNRSVWRDYLANTWWANGLATLWLVVFLVVLVITQSASGIGYLAVALFGVATLALTVAGIREDRS